MDKEKIELMLEEIYDSLLYKIKGITETKCKKYKVNDGYCKKCDNIYCSLNKNN